MKRGEIWTASGGADYGGKPRPVLILQSDRFETPDSVTVCPLTTDPTDMPFFRPALSPERGSGLKVVSRIMVDKVTTMRRSKLGRRIGLIGDEEMARLSRLVLVFLGLAD